MSIGLNIFNEEGRVILSSDYIFYNFIGKYNASLVESYVAYSILLPQPKTYRVWRAVVSCPSIPIVFLDPGLPDVQSDDAAELVGGGYLLGYRELGGNSYEIEAVSATPALTFYVFSSGVPSNQNYGMTVHKPDFSSSFVHDRKALKLAAISKGLYTTSINSRFYITPVMIYNTIPQNYAFFYGSGLTKISILHIPGSSPPTKVVITAGLGTIFPGGQRRVGCGACTHLGFQSETYSYPDGVFSSFMSDYACYFIDTDLYQ